MLSLKSKKTQNTQNTHNTAFAEYEPSLKKGDKQYAGTKTITAPTSIHIVTLLFKVSSKQNILFGCYHHILCIYYRIILMKCQHTKLFLV